MSPTRRILTLPALLGSCATLLAFFSQEGTAYAAKLEAVVVHPSFETAGVIAKLSGDSGNEVVTVDVKGPQDSDFHPAHHAVRFEARGAGTSLFGLSPDTDYDVRVTLADPDGVTGPATQTVKLHTRAEPKLPAPTRVRWVGTTGRDATDAGATKADPYASVTYALSKAEPGDEIRVLPGTYGATTASGKHGTEVAPIIVRADDPNTRPVIDGAGAGTAVQLNDTSFIVIDGFEIRNGGSDDDGIGLYLRASARVTVRNSFIHDNGSFEVLIAKAPEFSGGAQASGFHIIEDNDIADLTQETCSGASNDACPGQTYYGIKLDNNPGAGTVIRRNRVRGHTDNMSPCGDEGVGRGIADGAPVLALVGGGGTWTNHDLEIYDNRLENARDDDLELDGICVNARIYRNRIEDAQHGVSFAPSMPGPYFFLRNVVTGDLKESVVKLNTAGESNVPTRHVFLYHNVFNRASKGTILNLWFAVEGDHNVPIHDIAFRNNVFAAPNGGRATDAYNNGAEQPSFDGDVWWTTDQTKVFSWWTGSKNATYDTFSAFQAGAKQEATGAFGEPGLGADFYPIAGALVVDRGLVLPGINDGFLGAAPDVGAYELGGPKPSPGGPGGGPGGGGTDGGVGGGEDADGGRPGGGNGASGDASDASDDGCALVSPGTARGGSAVALSLAIAALAARRRRASRSSR